MAERGGYGVKRNYKLLNWEQNEFPIACKPCLGDSDYMRILKKPLGAECKLCTRPYTTFNWRTENHKMIKTEICSTCAKINNCCQSCIYDLKFGLPIDIRNKLMGDQKVELLMSEGNRDLFAHLANENYERLNLPYDKMDDFELGKGIGKRGEGFDRNGKSQVGGEGFEGRKRGFYGRNCEGLKIVEEFIEKNKKKDPDFEKKLKERKKICRFFLQGKCIKENCEFLHLNKKNLKLDEYYKMGQEQKNLTLNYNKSKKIFLNENSNFIRMKYINKNEEEIVREKIEELIDTEFEIVFENDLSLLKFSEKTDAEKFLKIFLDSFTINGRKISLEWFVGKKEYQSDDDFDIPLPSTIDKKIDQKDIKNIFLENLDKKFEYKKKEDLEGGKLNLVDY